MNRTADPLSVTGYNSAYRGVPSVNVLRRPPLYWHSLTYGHDIPHLVIEH